jgi:adenylate cyclase
MRSRGILALRWRLDSGDPDEFLLFSDLRAEGLTEYAARIVPYGPAQAEAIAKETVPPGRPPGPGEELDGIFFSCATDRPEGFDDKQLSQVAQTLPYLALVPGLIDPRNRL